MQYNENMSSNQLIICPLCEKLNPADSVICRGCGRDIRVSPLSDFESFVRSGFFSKKEKVENLYYRIRQKLKISHEILKSMSSKRESGKAQSIADFYRKQLESEHSCASYYLLMLSEDLFFDSYAPLHISMQVYFVLWQTYYSRKDLPLLPVLDGIFERGQKLTEEQYEKTAKILDGLLSGLNLLTEDSCRNIQWKYPPLPSRAWLFLGRKKSTDGA